MHNPIAELVLTFIDAGRYPLTALAATKFGGNLLIKVVFLVFGLPIPEGNPKIIDERTVNPARLTILLRQFVLRDKN